VSLCCCQSVWLYLFAVDVTVKGKVSTFLFDIISCIALFACSAIAFVSTLWFQKNAPTLADYNYDPVQSILIIFSKLFANDHKSCLVVKFSTSPHICCHYTL